MTPPKPRPSYLRAALWATLGALVAAVLAAVVTGQLHSGDDSAADGSGRAAGETGIVAVAVPTAEARQSERGADEVCSALAKALPSTLDGLPMRPTEPESPRTAAWGDPAVVLRCGVDRPDDFTATVETLGIGGVRWHHSPAQDDGTVLTAVDRVVYVEVILPAAYTADAVLSPLGEAIARVAPQARHDPARAAR